MNLFRLFLSVIEIINRICRQYTRQQDIEHGKVIAAREARKMQERRVEKARRARLSAHRDTPGRLHKDPYQRD